MSARIEVRDRRAIERYCRRDPARHLYELGDLDPFFWPDTRWWGLADVNGALQALALLYSGTALPTLLALGRNDDGASEALLIRIESLLPRHLYAHLSPGLAPLFSKWQPTPARRHLKMALLDPTTLDDFPSSDITRLGPGDAAELRAFYDSSYPGNWFEPRMLDTGPYVAIREAGVLRCVAGVHVYSAALRVAALGNITTAPDQRSRGLARRATAALCRLLSDTVDTIGLNVRADNHAAIACYRHLGFSVVADYDELSLERRGDTAQDPPTSG